MTELLALLGLGALTFSFGVIVLVFWTIFWKGWALWIAAKKNEKWWFIAILIFNTFGILEIIYIFFISKMKFNFKEKKFEERGETEAKQKETEKVIESEKVEKE